MPRAFPRMSFLVLAAAGSIMATYAACGAISGRMVDDQGRTVGGTRQVFQLSSGNASRSPNLESAHE